MAKQNCLVEGLSGAGKSAFYEELIRRGHKAISADRAWAYHADPAPVSQVGPISHDTWMWDQKKAKPLRRPVTQPPTENGLVISVTVVEVDAGWTVTEWETSGC